MKISYRTRRFLRRFATGLGIFLLIFILVYGLWVLWGKRYVVYTREGAKLDFSLQPMAEGEPVEETEPRPTVTLEQNAANDALGTPGLLSQSVGYYVDTDQLADSVQDVRRSIEQLPAGTAVMLDLKSKFGFFYYNTHVSHGSVATAVDIGAMDELINWLGHSDLYVIARIPAFRDRAFGLEQQEAGLPVASGALWSDDDACYWLDPASEITRDYLLSIIQELQLLGFDEVVFTEYDFPDTDAIVYDESVDRGDLLEETADFLVEQGARGNFAVSFQSDNPEFPMPQGRSRLFLTGVEASEAAAVAASTGLPNPVVDLVFLTEVNDTRFNAFGVLRPMPITAE